MSPLDFDHRIKGVIFDLDGTLIDSMGVWHRIDEKFLAKRGFRMDADYGKALKTMQYKEAAEYTIKRYQLHEKPDDIIREWDEMAVEEYRTNIRCKKGAEAFLHRLKRRGMKIGLATVSSPFLYEAVLKANGIFDDFDVFADVSQVSKGKEEPDLYLFTAGKMGVKPQECVVFEDVLPGIRSAHRAGFWTCGVKDHSSKEEQSFIQREADWYIEDFTA